MKSLVRKVRRPTKKISEVISQYLYMNYPFDNMEHVTDVLERGKVHVNGSVILDPNYFMREGDVVDVQISKLRTKTIDIPNPEAKKISRARVIYENEHIIVVSKRFEDTMEGDPKKNDLNSLVKEYLRSRKISTKSNIFLYRLHDEIKGLVIYSKTSKGYQLLDKAIRRNELKFTFLAASVNAPFYDEKRSFQLAPPFIRTQQNRLERVTQSNKDKVPRLDVKNIGKVKLRNMTYGLLEIKTLQIRRPNIRFLLSYYGMTIINDKSAMGNRYSNDIVLYLQKIQFPYDLQEIFGIGEIVLSKSKTIKIMNKILESNAKKQYA